ncbi:MAG: hypothetical protein QXQ94_11340 [Candidatus Bathyarchaeia archaeon]
MTRKSWVIVYLSKEQKQFLKAIGESLGIGESEVLSQAFMEYAKSIGLITKRGSCQHSDIVKIPQNPQNNLYI